MAIYSYWFLLALVLLGLEMATGTFYLLLVSVAMTVAGLAALLSAGIELQLVLCALTIISGTLILRRWKKARGRHESFASMDVGQPVQVLAWHDDGTARVSYRGAAWDAVPEHSEMPRNGTFYIKEIRGATLVISHQKPQNQ
ncbi:MAG: NfeD family protein [Gallionella sp.]|nr:NfeD family protein [Gallionella sp.]